MNPCLAASSGVCSVKGGVSPGCRESSDRNLGKPLTIAEGQRPWPKPVRADWFVDGSWSSRNQSVDAESLRSVAAIRATFWRRAGTGGTRRQAKTRHESSADVSARECRRGAELPFEGLGDTSPGEWGAAHEVAARGKAFPRTGKKIRINSTDEPEADRKEAGSRNHPTFVPQTRTSE